MSRGHVALWVTMIPPQVLAADFEDANAQVASDWSCQRSDVSTERCHWKKKLTNLFVKNANKNNKILGLGPTFLRVYLK